MSVVMPSGPIEEAFLLIKTMKVRGAGRIARTATKALSDYALTMRSSSPAEFFTQLSEAGGRLKAARPTAVSLPNSVNFLVSSVKRALDLGKAVEELRLIVRNSAEDFISHSLEAVDRIAEIGAKRISEGDVLLTHCQSDAASGVIIRAQKMGKNISVFVTETRPRFQGRLTAAWLARNGVRTTLITDSAARLYMGKVDKVIFGADAIAANGAVVNKIGTAQISLVAKEARARVFVAAESYKLSPQTFLGELVEIEERDADEVVPKAWRREHPAIEVRNPAFDVTPPEYIDLIITERGVFPPQGIILLMKELYQAS